MTRKAPAVDRSTLRLSEVARHVVIPEGIERSLWLGWDGQPGVESRVLEFGITFDRWQDGLSQVALGVTASGRFAATVGGIILSIPRQVAKTFWTMVIVIALCTMFPGLTVLWTAHRTRLSTQTFGKMKALVLSKRVRQHMPADGGIRTANGEQEILFRNGSRILFGARERGFGLGFDEVDIEVFDEAQRVTATALDDMVAATNQSRWTFGALLFFMGTPPRPSDAGEEFATRRKKALAIKAASRVSDFAGVAQGGSAVYVECSADSDVGRPGGPSVNDRRQVAIANPSYPHRTPDISIDRLWENLTNDDSKRREGLGVWDEDATGAALQHKTWLTLEDVGAERGAEPVFGVDVTEDRMAWVAVAWMRDDGDVQVMLTNEGEAIPAHRLAAECERLSSSWGADVMSPPAFVDDLDAAGALVRKVSSAQFAAASGVVDDLIRARAIRHGNQSALNTAVKVARWRSAGTQSERAFQLKDSPEVGPLAAVTRAIAGLDRIDGVGTDSLG